jgi:hypothetical protein
MAARRGTGVDRGRAVARAAVGDRLPRGADSLAARRDHARRRAPRPPARGRRPVAAARRGNAREPPSSRTPPLRRALRRLLPGAGGGVGAAFRGRWDRVCRHGLEPRGRSPAGSQRGRSALGPRALPRSRRHAGVARSGRCRRTPGLRALLALPRVRRTFRAARSRVWRGRARRLHCLQPPARGLRRIRAGDARRPARQPAASWRTARLVDRQGPRGELRGQPPVAVARPARLLAATGARRPGPRRPAESRADRGAGAVVRLARDPGRAPRAPMVRGRGPRSRLAAARPALLSAPPRPQLSPRFDRFPARAGLGRDDGPRARPESRPARGLARPGRGRRPRGDGRRAAGRGVSAKLLARARARRDGGSAARGRLRASRQPQPRRHAQPQPLRPLARAPLPSAARLARSKTPLGERLAAAARPRLGRFHLRQLPAASGRAFPRAHDDCLAPVAPSSWPRQPAARSLRRARRRPRGRRSAAGCDRGLREGAARRRWHGARGLAALVRAAAQASRVQDRGAVLLCELLRRRVSFRARTSAARLRADAPPVLVLDGGARRAPRRAAAGSALEGPRADGRRGRQGRAGRAARHRTGLGSRLARRLPRLVRAAGRGRVRHHPAACRARGVDDRPDRGRAGGAPSGGSERTRAHRAPARTPAAARRAAVGPPGVGGCSQRQGNPCVSVVARTVTTV